MIINLNKVGNKLHMANLTNTIINGQVHLILISQATKTISNYHIQPFTSNERYITIDGDVITNDVGIYNYKLIQGDNLINQGFLNVIKDKENEVVTPDLSSIDDEDNTIYYNGE